MKRVFLVCLLILGVGLNLSLVSAEDGFYVISVKKNNYAPVPKTGQTTSFATGDDGDLEKGVAWPDPRLTDNGNGTVTDNLTGLIWLKNADCFGQKNWATALSDCNNLTAGYCGLTDGSVAGDWRLSNIKEIQSLIDYGNYSVALPSGHPFALGFSKDYWLSTTHPLFTQEYAWYVIMVSGTLDLDSKVITHRVWCVRDGN
jgi:hypothetical protein